jgi:hypothetical protein
LKLVCALSNAALAVFTPVSAAETLLAIVVKAVASAVFASARAFSASNLTVLAAVTASSAFFL